MIHDFIYNIPVKVYFGRNHLHHLGEELKHFGTRVLMTYGGGSIKRMGLYDKVVKEIKAAGLELFELDGIEPNPRIDSVRKGAQMCKDHKSTCSSLSEAARPSTPPNGSLQVPAWTSTRGISST